MRLVPDLRNIRSKACSVVDLDQDLFLEILEHAPYTTLLRLTHYFPHHDGKVYRTLDPVPDTLLRAYHDSGHVEVLDLRQTALPVHMHYLYSALETKWKANLYLVQMVSLLPRAGVPVCHRAGVPVNPATEAPLQVSF